MNSIWNLNFFGRNSRQFGIWISLEKNNHNLKFFHVKHLFWKSDWWLWKEYIMFHSLSPNLHITAYQWHGDRGLPQKPTWNKNVQCPMLSFRTIYNQSELWGFVAVARLQKTIRDVLRKPRRLLVQLLVYWGQFIYYISCRRGAL